MSDGTYGGYSSEGYGGYGYGGGGYSGEAYGLADDLGNPAGLANVDRALEGYSGSYTSPGWNLAATLAGLLSPARGLGIKGVQAGLNWNDRQNWANGPNASRDAAGFIEGLGGVSGPGAYDQTGSSYGGAMSGGPNGGGWGSGDLTSLLSQYGVFSPVKPVSPVVSMVADKSMPWINRDAAGNITGSFRHQQRAGQEKLTW